jgi:hypothetical protein
MFIPDPGSEFSPYRIQDPGSKRFRDPGSGSPHQRMGKKSRSEFEMNIPDHISESLEEIIFWVKIFKALGNMIREVHLESGS